MPSCRYSVRTSLDAKLPLNDETRPVFALVGGEWVRLHSAAQLRRFEREQGRVQLQQRNLETGNALSCMSHQLTNASTPGGSEVEKDHGAHAASTYTLLTERGAGYQAAKELAKAVANAPDQLAAVQAVDLASRLVEGGANRNARHLRSVVQAGAAATLAHELSVLFAHPDDDLPAAGITVRDLHSARAAAALVLAARAAAYSPVPLPGPSNLSRLLARELVASHHGAGNVPWVLPPYEEADTHMSGFKLHVYCEGSEDVTAALQRLAPLLDREQITCKFASAAYAGSAHSQARKGVTVYLPRRADAGRISAEVVSAMAGWHHDRAPGDDLSLGNGVGLRFELGLDLGVEVDRDTYHVLYQRSGAAPTDAVAAVRRAVYDSPADPHLLAAHIRRSGAPEDDFAAAASAAPHCFEAAVAYAAAGVPVDDVAPGGYAAPPAPSPPPPPPEAAGVAARRYVSAPDSGDTETALRLLEEVMAESGDHTPKAGSPAARLDLILAKRGFDSLPETVASVDELPEGQTVYHRGVATPEQAEDFLHGDYFVGIGNFGNGVYASSAASTAADRAGGNATARDSRVVTFALRPDARVLSYDEAVALAEELQKRDPGDGSWNYPEDPIVNIAYDPSNVAALLGYDAITVERREEQGFDVIDPGETYLILLNRSAAIAVDPRSGERPPTTTAQPQGGVRGPAAAKRPRRQVVVAAP